jgi:hypothetical protein
MKTLFLVMDTVRRDYLEAYGNSWVKTPNLNRLAQRGVTFDNHWVGSLPCTPARREFRTGRHNFLFRGWGPIEPYDDTLPCELRKRGVLTHLLTDHDHYFELGGENYHTAFNTWEFFRGQERDRWISLIDSIALPDEPDYIGRHQLFDLGSDPDQLAPLDDSALEAHFVARIAANLQAFEAPPEQYVRLGYRV